jgi:hypothetical protein
MRIRDKIRVENGYITKAKVKWYGDDTFAYLYLWKVNKADTEYKESWSNLRLPEDNTENKQRKPNQNIAQKREKKNGLGF